jgi:hypothetical protein
MKILEKPQFTGYKEIEMVAEAETETERESSPIEADEGREICGAGGS